MTNSTSGESTKGLVLRNCNYCDKEYTAERRYLNRGQGLFCSQSCSSTYHRAQLPKQEPNTECAWCQVTFYKKPSQKHSKSGLYFCNKDHQSKGFSDPNIAVVSGPAGTPKLTCRNCGKVSRRTNSLCHKCETATRISAWLDGDNSVTFYDGATKAIRPFVKQYLIETRRDNCDRCGFATPEEWKLAYSSIITMDHIDGNCHNNDPSNLQLLCPNCHAMTPTYGSRNKGSGRAHRRKSASGE